MEQTKKLVRHDIFCNGGELDGKSFPPCINRDIDEVEEPCNSCLATPVNDNSRKPINYIPKENK